MLVYGFLLSFYQEKQLQVNMKINKLRETVKAHQEKVNHACDSKIFLLCHMEGQGVPLVFTTLQIS